jgi:iron complex transport system substrate-binding protein
LGEGDRLLARDTTSYQPAEVQMLPDVGYLHALSSEGILSLDPGLILAEASAGPLETIDILREASAEFVSVPKGFDAKGVMRKVEVVAKALGVPEKGDALAARIEADFAALASRVKRQSAKPKRVLFVLSARSGTVRVAGKDTPVDAMISLAGGVNVASDLSGYKAMNEEALIMAAPDFILMASYPGSSPPDVEELFALPALSLSPAASKKATLIMDALELAGFGPRTAQSALMLYDALYGE